MREIFQIQQNLSLIFFPSKDQGKTWDLAVEELRFQLFKSHFTSKIFLPTELHTLTHQRKYLLKPDFWEIWAMLLLAQKIKTDQENKASGLTTAMNTKRHSYHFGLFTFPFKSMNTYWAFVMWKVSEEYEITSNGCYKVHGLKTKRKGVAVFILWTRGRFSN